jgi:predicted transglutaminase-like cysteine proteinase
MLESVNLYVNEHVDQATNLEVYGVDQFWTRSGTKHGARGDCKGLSIEKRLELIALGYPAADLFYAIAYQTDMGLHAVLVAHTEVGDLVLDSRSPRIALWSQTAYTWVKRQAPNAPATWVLAMG